MSACAIGVATWGLRRLINQISGSDISTFGIYDTCQTTSGTFQGLIISGTIQTTASFAWSWLDARGLISNPNTLNGPTLNSQTGSYPFWDTAINAITNTVGAVTGSHWMTTKTQNRISALPITSSISMVYFGILPQSGAHPGIFGGTTNGSQKCPVGVAESINDNCFFGIFATSATGTMMQITAEATTDSHGYSQVSASDAHYKCYIAAVLTGSSAAVTQKAYSPNTPVSSSVVVPPTPLNSAITIFDYWPTGSDPFSQPAVTQMKGLLFVNHDLSNAETASILQFGQARYGCVA